MTALTTYATDREAIEAALNAISEASSECTTEGCSVGYDSACGIVRDHLSRVAPSPAPNTDGMPLIPGGGRELRAKITALEAERDRLLALINAPELHDFARGVVLEAAHQRNRWGLKHDAEKTDEDWHWLVAHIAGKALHGKALDVTAQENEKRLHRIITIAAVAANWHAACLVAQSGTEVKS